MKVNHEGGGHWLHHEGTTKRATKPTTKLTTKPVTKLTTRTNHAYYCRVETLANDSAQEGTKCAPSRFRNKKNHAYVPKLVLMRGFFISCFIICFAKQSSVNKLLARSWPLVVSCPSPCLLPITMTAQLLSFPKRFYLI